MAGTPRHRRMGAIQSDVAFVSSLFKGRPGGIFGGEKFAPAPMRNQPESPSILAGRLARCNGQPSRGRAACRSKPLLNPLFQTGRKDKHKPHHIESHPRRNPYYGVCGRQSYNRIACEWFRETALTMDKRRGNWVGVAGRSGSGRADWSTSKTRDAANHYFHCFLSVVDESQNAFEKSAQEYSPVRVGNGGGSAISPKSSALLPHPASLQRSNNHEESSKNRRTEFLRHEFAFHVGGRCRLSCGAHRADTGNCRRNRTQWQGSGPAHLPCVPCHRQGRGS